VISRLQSIRRRRAPSASNGMGQACARHRSALVARFEQPRMRELRSRMRTKLVRTTSAEEHPLPHEAVPRAVGQCQWASGNWASGNWASGNWASGNASRAESGDTRPC
jgi:hypothetical protein